MRFEELAGERVAVWGLGREGRSFLDLWSRRFPGERITVLNDAPLSEDSLPGHARAVFGPAVPAALEKCSVVIKSPGISLYRPEIEAARRRGVRFTSTNALWFTEHAAETIVAVTGTKGKSTTSSLVAHLLPALGKSAILAGNIGVPLFDLFDQRQPDGVWVIELSSYQICDLEVFPDIAVLLNLYPEHNDWHGSVERYFEDKLRLFRGQGPAARSLINRADPRSMAADIRWRNPSYFNDPAGLHAAHGMFCDGSRRLFPTAACSLSGDHNLSNVCAALSVVAALGLDPARAEQALQGFSGLPHRLQPIGERNGVLYVDDSISTIPEAALAALAAYSSRPVTILLGGQARAQEWARFAEGLKSSSARFVITMPDNGAEIAAAVRAAGLQNVEVRETASLEEAVRVAERVTRPGGVVMLSPGSPSYGRFRNFEERGEVFRGAAIGNG